LIRARQRLVREVFATSIDLQILHCAEF